MSTALTVRVNTTSNDNPYSSDPSDFTNMDLANDYLIFSNGSDVVTDGASIPSETALSQAGTVVSDTADVEVDKCFLADFSENKIEEIFNYAGNKRYVYCFSFDGATVSEPVLELWDDTDMDSTDLYSLGNGTPADSWWKGAVTTDGLPGIDWSGLALAGSSTNHFLWLNNGGGASPLSGAKDLYCNLKIIIPAGTTVSGIEQPVMVVKYARS